MGGSNLPQAFTNYLTKWLLPPTNPVSLARHEAAIATVRCQGPPPTNYCHRTHTCLVSRQVSLWPKSRTWYMDRPQL